MVADERSAIVNGLLSDGGALTCVLIENQPVKEKFAMSVQLRRSVFGLCTLFLVIASSSNLNAATVADRLSGRWEAEITGDGKTFSIDFEFRTKGSSLTGTVELPFQDRSAEIQNGKIDGNRISFKGLGLWTGTLEGNQLTLTRELDHGKKQHLKAHRKPGA
jgi:hypothetical protein